MSSLPPLSEVLDALFRCILPSGAVAAAVFTFITGLAMKRLSGFAAALALTLAFVQGNYLREAVPLWIEGDQFPTFAEVGQITHRALFRPVSEAGDDQPPLSVDAWYWLPWTAALALLADLLLGLPRVPRLLAWVVRLLIALLAARLLLPETLHREWPWPEACLAAAMLGIWLVGHQLEGRQPGGLLALALSVSFFGAAGVLMEAHSLRLTDVALIGMASLAGVALVAWRLQEEVKGVSGAAAVLLPALLLIGQQGTFAEIPIAAYALAACSPLVLAILLLPGVNKLSGRWLAMVAVGCVFIPVVPALTLAKMAAP